MAFFSSLRQFTTVLTVAFTLAIGPAFAQSGGGKPAETQKSTADTVKEGQKKIDEIAEATRLINGPAGNPECVWLGRRVVSLLWRDDLDTAFVISTFTTGSVAQVPISRPLSAAWCGKETSIPRPRKPSTAGSMPAGSTQACRRPRPPPPRRRRLTPLEPPSADLDF